MWNSRNSNSDAGLGGCLVVFIMFGINVVLGGWAVHTILAWFGKNIPVFVDVVIGLFIGSLAIPIAIAGSILKAFGVF